MTGWQSNLLLTLPLVAFVAGGLGLWSALETWCDRALDDQGDLQSDRESESFE